jgi:hypothetical protein
MNTTPVLDVAAVEAPQLRAGAPRARYVRRYPRGIADWEAAGYPVVKPDRSRVERVPLPPAPDRRETASPSSKPCSCSS